MRIHIKTHVYMCIICDKNDVLKSNITQKICYCHRWLGFSSKYVNMLISVCDNEFDV